MFGRVRASPISSLELLEMERPPPKIVKRDTLSIYVREVQVFPTNGGGTMESTLLKLKQGSQCNTRSNPEDSKMDATDSAGEATTADADCSSNDSTCGESSISFQSTYSSKESRNMSILYFFSKCKSPRSSKDKEAMAVESGYSSSSSSVSTTSSS